MPPRARRRTPTRVQRRLAEREFEEDGWHVVVGADRRPRLARGRQPRPAHGARLARPAAQAAVPLLAATERLGDSPATRSAPSARALLDEALDLTQAQRRGGPRGLAAPRGARVGDRLRRRAACVMVVAGADAGRNSSTPRRRPASRTSCTTRNDRAVGAASRAARSPSPRALGRHPRAGLGRPIEDIGDVPRSYRDAELAVERVRDGHAGLRGLRPRHARAQRGRAGAHPPARRRADGAAARQSAAARSAGRVLRARHGRQRHRGGDARPSRTPCATGSRAWRSCSAARCATQRRSPSSASRYSPTPSSGGRAAPRGPPTISSSALVGQGQVPVRSQLLRIHRSTRCHGALGQTLTQPCAAKEDGRVAGRNTERDGTANQLEFHVLTHYEPVWRVLQRPRLRPHVNRLLINSAVNKVPTRPNPLSTLAPYTSWSSLTDRTLSTPATCRRGQIANLPPAEEVADLFVRRGEDVLCAEVDGHVRLLRAVVHRRLPAQRPARRTRPAPQRRHPRDRPAAALRRAAGLDRAAARARGRAAEEPDHRRRRVPALPVRERRDQARVQPDQGRAPRADPARAARRPVRRGQRHDELADRLRADEHAVPARAQPDRRRARSTSTPAGTTSACSRPPATS